MQTVIETSAYHDTARELVNDKDLAVLNNVVDVLSHRTVSLDSLIDMMQKRHILGIHKVDDVERLLRLLYTALCKRSRPCLLVDDVVSAERIVIGFVVHLNDSYGFECLSESVCERIQLSRLVALTRDDERSSRLVYEYRVHLVHDSERVLSLHLVLFVYYHVVTQVIEAELVVRTVGDIREISLSLIVLAHARQHAADSAVQELEHLAHFLRLELSEVVVDGNNVNASAVERVSVSSKAGNKRFTFTCFHFCDTSLMQNDSTNDLNGVRLFAQHSERSLTAYSECIAKHIVQRFAFLDPVTEDIGLCGQLLVVHSLIFLLQIKHLLLDRLYLFKFFFGVVAE